MLFLILLLKWAMINIKNQNKFVIKNKKQIEKEEAMSWS